MYIVSYLSREGGSGECVLKFRLFVYGGKWGSLIRNRFWRWLFGKLGWGETTRTLVPWRGGFRHPTRNECMGWFAQIQKLVQVNLVMLQSSRLVYTRVQATKIPQIWANFWIQGFYTRDLVQGIIKMKCIDVTSLSHQISAIHGPRI